MTPKQQQHADALLGYIDQRYLIQYREALGDGWDTVTTARYKSHAINLAKLSAETATRGQYRVIDNMRKCYPMVWSTETHLW